MISLITSIIPWEWIAAALTGLTVVVSAWFASGRNAKQKAEQKAKIDAQSGWIASQKERERIDHEIDQDPDLVARAKRSGVVHDG